MTSPAGPSSTPVEIPQLAELSGENEILRAIVAGIDAALPQYEGEDLDIAERGTRTASGLAAAEARVAALVAEVRRLTDEIDRIDGNVAEVYCAITDGLLSKSTYESRVVIAHYEDDVNTQIGEAVAAAKARAVAAEAARDRWEREAKGMTTECRDVSGILAAALGYPDMRHTDAPLGVVISNWLAQEITSRLTAAEAAIERVRGIAQRWAVDHSGFDDVLAALDVRDAAGATDLDAIREVYRQWAYSSPTRHTFAPEAMAQIGRILNMRAGESP